MLKKPSQEWDDYTTRLQSIKLKSNREVLCTECWMILNYEQRGKHSKKFPCHKESILTSSQFASEYQFLSLAIRHNKVVEKEDDVKLVIQPCLFDPKKGTGHMKMIEELCHEMHTVTNGNSLEESKNGDDISDIDNNDVTFSAPQETFEHKQTVQQLSNMDSKLDDMIRDIAVFEQSVHEQFCSCLNKSQQVIIQKNAGTSNQNLVHKRRKFSDLESP